MHRFLPPLAGSAALALALVLAGCSGSSAPGSSAASASATAASAHPATSAATPTRSAAPKYPAAAKSWINENVCVAKAPSCKHIKGYGMVGGYALVAYTNIHADSDAAASAQPICSWLLGYIVDKSPSSSDVSSDAYVYGSAGSRILKCHTPVDRG